MTSIEQEKFEIAIISNFLQEKNVLAFDLNDPFEIKEEIEARLVEQTEY